MRYRCLAVAMLLGGTESLCAQTMTVTLIEKTRTSTTYQARSGDTDAPNRGRALPMPAAPDGTPSVPRTYTVTGANLHLQLPDGRVVEAVCTDKMGDPSASQPSRSCLTPDGGPLLASFKGTAVKLTWRVDHKKLTEMYSVLPLTLPVLAPPDPPTP